MRHLQLESCILPKLDCLTSQLGRAWKWRILNAVPGFDLRVVQAAPFDNILLVIRSAATSVSIIGEDPSWAKCERQAPQAIRWRGMVEVVRSAPEFCSVEVDCQKGHTLGPRDGCKGYNAMCLVVQRTLHGSDAGFGANLRLQEAR